MRLHFWSWQNLVEIWQILSTFEFLLELNTRCKDKSLLGFKFSVRYKADSKQNMVYSAKKLNGLNGRTNSNFLKIPELEKTPTRPF